MKLDKQNRNSKVKKEVFRSRKAKNGGSSNFDLLYQLSYMSAMASAGAPRDRVFELGSKLDCSTARYFRKMQLMRTKLGYDYSRVCRMVGESTEDEQIKALLFRFSSSLMSGESEVLFLAREAEAQAEIFKNEYNRKLESLKRWTDAYVSLVLGAVLIVIIGAVASMLWKMEPVILLAMAGICIGTTVMGVWLLYLMSPRDLIFPHSAGSKEQKLVKKLAKVLLPCAVIIGILLLISRANFGFILVITAAFILPVGFIAYLDDKKVNKRDAEVGTFLVTLGGVCSALQTTTKDALSRVGVDSVLALRAEVRRLHTRLLTGIRAGLCWQKFSEETGGELTKRSVGMFYDAVQVGGEPDKAGYRASQFAIKISTLRADRKTTSAPFLWLCIAMHAAIITLLVFIVEVITMFGKLVGDAEKGMPDISNAPSTGALTSFNFSGLELMHRFVIPLVLIFTVADALAPSIVDGANKYKFLYNLGITAVISGTSLIFLPKLASMMFKSVEI